MNTSITSEIKQRRLSLLEETASHFNINNRSTNSDGGCTYYPVNLLSEGCAIGRLIKDKELCQNLDIHGYFIDDKNAFSKLPLDLQELGKLFLRTVQILHDEEKFWDNQGLTVKGEKAKQDIIIKFCSEQSIV